MDTLTLLEIHTYLYPSPGKRLTHRILHVTFEEVPEAEGGGVPRRGSSQIGCQGGRKATVPANTNVLFSLPMVMEAPAAAIIVKTSEGKLSWSWVSIKLPAHVPTWNRTLVTIRHVRVTKCLYYGWIWVASFYRRRDKSKGEAWERG